LHDVASIGKGRLKPPLYQAGVESGMVKVQVGVDHQ